MFCLNGEVPAISVMLALCYFPPGHAELLLTSWIPVYSFREEVRIGRDNLVIFRVFGLRGVDHPNCCVIGAGC